MNKVFILLTAALIQSCSAFNQNTQINSITARGAAEITAIPDNAKFSFTVRHEAKDVAEAQQKMSENALKVTDFLRNQGIEEKDIKTTSYHSSPKYTYTNTNTCSKKHCPQGSMQKRVLIGYEVFETFAVSVNNTTKIGELLSGIAKLGVAEVSNLSFEVSDPEKMKSVVRTQAILKAKLDAKLIADNLGVKLNKVIGFIEEDQGYLPRSFMAKTMNASAEMSDGFSSPQIQSGEQKIISKVSITYEIK